MPTTNRLASVCLLLLTVVLATPASASTRVWEFQDTGFETERLFFRRFGTALTMRNGFAWPIISAPAPFSPDRINSYSLFSVPNPELQQVFGIESFWHPIDSGRLIAEPSGVGRLRAASHASGQFAYTVSGFDSSDSVPTGVSVIGNSFSGFGQVVNGVNALEFDPAGNPISTQNTLPPGVSASSVIDLAVASTGEFAHLTSETVFGSQIEVWQNHPLIGWAATPLIMNDQPTLLASSLDLEFDSSPQATPHVAGVNQNGDLIVYDFDPRTANWESQTLDGIMGQERIGGVTLADNRDGVLGAAWVNDGVLKYAFRDTLAVNPVWTVTTVPTPTGDGSPVLDGFDSRQTVGLAFDFNGLPLISYVAENSQGQPRLWLAYDPPVAVPEPSSLLLGALALAGVGFRRRAGCER